MSGGGGPAALAANRIRSTNRLRIEKREAKKRQRHGFVVGDEELDCAHGGDRHLLRTGARARGDAVASHPHWRPICRVSRHVRRRRCLSCRLREYRGREAGTKPLGTQAWACLAIARHADRLRHDLKVAPPLRALTWCHPRLHSPRHHMEQEPAPGQHEKHEKHDEQYDQRERQANVGLSASRHRYQ
jgi:hypothetical protein